MATVNTEINGITYYAIATYKDVNDVIGFESFTSETNRCLSDTVANTKNYIGYPGKPSETGKLLAFTNLNLLKKVKLTIKASNTYGIMLNWIRISYQRKQNNTYTTVMSDMVFGGAIVDVNSPASVDIVSPHENDMAIYGELGVPVTEKAVKIEISAYRIYGATGNAIVHWSTDTNTTGKDLGTISASTSLSYTFDLAKIDSTQLLPSVIPVFNDLWLAATTECIILFNIL